MFKTDSVIIYIEIYNISLFILFIIPSVKAYNTIKTNYLNEMQMLYYVKCIGIHKW